MHAALPALAATSNLTFRNTTTCVADGTVSLELLSAIEFPDKQGKNRDSLRFWPFLNRPRAEKSSAYLINFDKIPTQWNREIFLDSRDLLRLIKECTKADQGINNAPRHRSNQLPEGGRRHICRRAEGPSVTGWSNSRLFPVFGS